MKNILKEFTQLRASLLKRQVEVQDELASINAALGTLAAATATVAPVAAPAAPAERSARPGPRQRTAKDMSLAEAVLTVTKGGPLAKQEILDAVLKLGYKFSTKDPMNSLSTTLYSHKKIKNFGGKFGPKWLIRPSSL